jgi:hypothetical protein
MRRDRIAALLNNNEGRKQDGIHYTDFPRRQPAR